MIDSRLIYEVSLKDCEDLADLAGKMRATLAGHMRTRTSDDYVAVVYDFTSYAALLHEPFAAVLLKAGFRVNPISDPNYAAVTYRSVLVSMETNHLLKKGFKL